MPKARLISGCATAKQGTFCAVAAGTLLFRHPVTPATANNASGLTRAYQVNCCWAPLASERESLRRATCRCPSRTGASFQATLGAGFTSGSTVRYTGSCTHQVRHLEPEAPSDNINLHRTSILQSSRHPQSLRVQRIILMDSSAHHGNIEAPQIQGETSRSTEGPTAQQWQYVKEEIRDLYTHKPLKDVRAILEQKHGFRAT